VKKENRDTARSVYIIVYGIIREMCFILFYWFFGTKEKFASVGIKGSHVWLYN
jgi:hypothetical protein